MESQVNLVLRADLPSSSFILANSSGFRKENFFSEDEINECYRRESVSSSKQCASTGAELGYTVHVRYGYSPAFGFGADPCSSISFSKSFSRAFRDSFSGLSPCSAICPSVVLAVSAAVAARTSGFAGYRSSSTCSSGSPRCGWSGAAVSWGGRCCIGRPNMAGFGAICGFCRW